MTFDESKIEALLEAVVTGERSESDAEVQAAVHSVPGFAERLATLRGLVADLDAIGADERLAVAEATASVPIEALVERGLDARDRTRSRRRAISWSAAAALLVGVVSFVWWPGSQPDVYLDLRDREMHPAGIYSAATEFAWRLDRPVGGRYELRFYREDDVDRFEPVWRFDAGDATTWKPTPQQLERLPNPMLWEVVVRDVDDRRVDDIFARAHRD